VFNDEVVVGPLRSNIMIGGSRVRAPLAVGVDWIGDPERPNAVAVGGVKGNGHSNLLEGIRDGF